MKKQIILTFKDFWGNDQSLTTYHLLLRGKTILFHNVCKHSQQGMPIPSETPHTK